MRGLRDRIAMRAAPAPLKRDAPSLSVQSKPTKRFAVGAAAAIVCCSTPGFTEPSGARAEHAANSADASRKDPRVTTLMLGAPGGRCNTRDATLSS